MWAISLFALLSYAAQPQVPDEVCIPSSDGSGWTCGTNLDESHVGTVPQRSERSIPPLLLIDPRRFDSEFIDDELPPEPESEPISATPPPPPPPPMATPVPPPPRAVAPAPTHAAQSPGGSGHFALQLAATSSPNGFPALLTKLGLDRRQARTVQISDSTWLLLYGDFPSAKAARAAIPPAAEGAWPRDLSTLGR